VVSLAAITRAKSAAATQCSACAWRGNAFGLTLLPILSHRPSVTNEVQSEYMCKVQSTQDPIMSIHLGRVSSTYPCFMLNVQSLKNVPGGTDVLGK